ncbi:u2 small nuclear ribonucleoprotein a [Chrysochromulina tobinii]|uniref:U2 small nuclear ribonucleoprotein a n=1 Tax=Chrysochromulina tobinii TaxID=1460289 RepID=A0A0M0JB13_9EUKA|nr:u2 small nuclear ribonucleoprotein a [Chrysochromulina tobinii]|eukprot:KOO23675.1 u2 small nuclear ribonucleoprotein a [Chrysochromulina sp. CCMP291]
MIVGSLVHMSFLVAAMQDPLLPDCTGGNISAWLACRQNLIHALFNASSLPSRSNPDYVVPMPNYAMHGFPGPGDGVGDVSGNSWSNNMTALVWTIETPFITLNSTVYHTLNTSGRAPRNWPQDGPSMPGPAIVPTARGDTVVFYHNGHETNKCTPNYDGVVDHFNQLGYDVFEFFMPLYGCNGNTPYETSSHHEWFEQWELKGDFPLRFFIEPVILSVNYAVNVLGYKHVVLVGLSGGGWTTTVTAAVDPRIKLSIPIAGSVPKWPTTLYPNFVPDLPEAQHVHDGLVAVNRFIHAQPSLGGWMQTYVTSGNIHQANYRDKVIVATLIERLRRFAFLNPLKDRELDLRGNKIAVMENLAATQDQFDSLDLSDNEILKVECMAVLPRLTQLLLNNNRVTRISEGLSKTLPSLKTLVLTNNHLATLTQLEPLGQLAGLTSLSLVDNPVTKAEGYRAYVIALLPKLRTLDFKRVRGAERAAAEAAHRKSRKPAPMRGPGTSGSGARQQQQQQSAAPPPLLKAGPSEEQKAKIMLAIANASSIEEVKRLEAALKAGDYSAVEALLASQGGGEAGSGSAAVGP